jgi:hypothetical protein
VADAVIEACFRQLMAIYHIEGHAALDTKVGRTGQFGSKALGHPAQDVSG